MTVNEFITLTKKDAAFMKALDTEKPEGLAAFVEFAKRHGCEIETEELKDAALSDVVGGMIPIQEPKEEVETVNKKLAELNQEELRQVFGGETLSDEWESKVIYKAMFNYISMMDEFHAVYVYRSKGFQLDGADSMNIHALFKQIFGHEIEESQYFE